MVGSLARRSEISWIGWIEPISLLTAITETKIVSGRNNPARASTSTNPCSLTSA